MERLLPTNTRLWRGPVFGVLGGAVLSGLVEMIDVVRALQDTQYRAPYGTWSGLLIALPVGAFVGLGCSGVATAVYLATRERPRLPVRCLTSSAAALPLIVLGLGYQQLFALALFFGLGAIAFGLAYLTFPLIAPTNRTQPD